MLLRTFGQHVNEMMAVDVKKIHNFLWSSIFIIKQNVNMTTNAILHCGLTSNKRKSWSQHGYNILYAYVLVIVVSLIVDITGNLDEIISLLQKKIYNFIICNNVMSAHIFENK